MNNISPGAGEHAPMMSSFLRCAPVCGAVLAMALGAGAARAQQMPANATLRMAGSNTVGQVLAVEMAIAWAKKLGLTGVRTEAGKAAEEYEIVAEGAERAGRLRVQVRAHGTGTGVEPLVRGDGDIWMASRQARESDLEGVRKKGVQDVPTLAQFHAPGNEHVVALDALAILSHPANQIAQISIAQLRDIFQGKITRWSQLGGQDLPITVISRDHNSGTFDTFCTLVMGIGDTAKCGEAMKPSSPRLFESSEELADTVAANPAAIGFVGAAYQRSAKAVPIALSCGLAVDLDTFRVKADEYPLSRRLYMYSHPVRPLNAETANFLAFAQTADGQGVVSRSGAVDLLPAPSDPNYANARRVTAANSLDGGRTRIRLNDLRALEAATNGAVRLSITFRFQPGSDALDSRAVADIRRLREALRSPAFARSAVTLVGFSQAMGDYEGNRELSRDRAEAVRKQLVDDDKALPVTVLGVGPAAPVTCNDDMNTARMNQRVEVWVRRPQGS